MTNGRIEMIDIALIDPPAWDSRLAKTGALATAEHKKLVDLAAELNDPKIGQLQPIEVEEKGNGRFERVIGGRRLAAAKINGWTQIRAEIRPQSLPSERIVRNIAENLSREDLTTFERARAASQLADLGLKNPDIAPRLKVSPSHVSNLKGLYKDLPAPVLKEWEKSNPVATVDNLLAVRKEADDDLKLIKWDALLLEAAEREAAGQKTGKRGKGKEKDKGGKGEASSSAGFPVSQKRLGYCLQVLSSAKLSPDLEPDGRKWAKALLDFICKGRETPPKGIPAMPTKADAAKEEKVA